MHLALILLPAAANPTLPPTALAARATEAVTLASTVTQVTTPAPAAGGQNPFARAALDAFTNKCSQCHGESLPFPKAEFGFITNLSRLAASPRHIVPGDLAKSEVWKMISGGDMPPDSAREGPLSAEQTEAIRQWILHGAPSLTPGGAAATAGDTAGAFQGAPPAPASSSSVPPSRAGAGGLPASQKVANPSPQRMAKRPIILLGRLHVVAVHFPIALLLLAALLELVAWARKSPAIALTARINLGCGAAAAVLAAGLGWIHALDGYANAFSGTLADLISTISIHRWLGTGVAILAPIVAIMAARELHADRRSMRVRLAIFALALAAGATGHFGGMLTHGAEFLSP